MSDTGGDDSETIVVYGGSSSASDETESSCDVGKKSLIWTGGLQGI